MQKDGGYSSPYRPQLKVTTQSCRDLALYCQTCRYLLNQTGKHADRRKAGIGGRSVSILDSEHSAIPRLKLKQTCIDPTQLSATTISL